MNNLQTDKEKLESYTKETLHTFQDKYMVAIAHCKMQLAEKNEKIDYLEVRHTLLPILYASIISISVKHQDLSTF